MEKFDKDQLLAALASVGIHPGDKIEIRTPTFHRTDGITVDVLPMPLPQAFDAIRKLPNEALKALGLGLWGRTSDVYGDKKSPIGDCEIVTWLYPEEWYSRIPEGYPVVDIFGKTEEFHRGETDNDIRFGALSFGFCRRYDGLPKEEVPHV